MGNIKLFVLSTLFLGQLAFACGSTITGGGAGSTEQTNTSSPCPNNTSQADTTPTYNTSYGPSYSAAAKAAEDAAKAAAKIAEAKAKKQYCKDNNYPTSVTFCVAQKEAKNKCLKDNLEALGLCRNDVESERNQRLDAVYNAAVSDMDAAGVVYFEVNIHAELRAQSCKEDKAVDDAWCESNY